MKKSIIVMMMSTNLYVEHIFSHD